MRRKQQDEPAEPGLQLDTIRAAWEAVAPADRPALQAKLDQVATAWIEHAQAHGQPDRS